MKMEKWIVGVVILLGLIIIGGIEVKKDPNAKILIGLWLDRMKPLIEALDLPSL